MNLINQLFTTYTIVDVVLILFLTAFVLQEILKLIDFFKNRAKHKYDEEMADQKTEDKILDKIEDLEDQFSALYHDGCASLNDIRQTLQKHDKTLERLIQSDKDDIRADIVKQHHYFITKGYIDDFSMDAIEKRYDHYKAEGGNSYISDLMHDLRKLPKK